MPPVSFEASRARCPGFRCRGVLRFNESEQYRPAVRRHGPSQNADFDRTVIRQAQNLEKHQGLRSHIEESFWGGKPLIAYALRCFGMTCWRCPIRFPRVLLKPFGHPIADAAPRSVHSRTPVLLHFQVALPSVAATGRWRKRGRMRRRASAPKSRTGV